MPNSTNYKPSDTQPAPKATAAQARLERSIRALWAAVVVIALIAILSLAVNVLVVMRLLAIRNALSSALTNASHSLDNLAGQGVSFELPISQTVNFEGDVPIKQDLNFPVKVNVPINTTVSIPLDLGPVLGTQTVSVPVNTTVPVDINVPVHVEQTVHIKTQVPVRANIPIRLSPSNPPLKDLLAQIRAWLESIGKFL